MSVKTVPRTLPRINITSTDQMTSQRSTKMYNDSSIVKSGILELCHLVSSANGNTVKELVGEKVLVTIYRTCGEFFAVINLLNSETGQQLSNSSIPNMGESNSICINLKHATIEKCQNNQFFKLVLNDFTSVILFRVVKSKEQQTTHLQTPQQQSINNQQSKSLGDLSVINEIDSEQDNQKSIQNDETQCWVKAFSEHHQSNEGDNHMHLLRAINLTPLTRRQSLQTVIESDEEEEQQFHSLQ